jgi:hypothetical protein
VIHDPVWRLNNLYRIVDKKGDSIPFKLNPVQADVLANLHSRNIILKARQLGMSTFAVLYLVDKTMFAGNSSAGIVSYSLEHAQHIFKRIIGHALDTFPEELRPYMGIVNRSAREISFDNGSFLRVDTSLRGGSYQSVLVSEFGKTCARSPQKAEEVITGTLQAVSKDGLIIIESTGEGNEGFYAEMVNNAHLRGNDSLSELEYKLFFYPWMDEPEYATREKITYDVELTDYFDKIERETGREITQHQRNWYALQSKLLGDKIKQEFPSTVSEAFLASSDAFYFAKGIAKAYEDGRCLQTSPYDALFPMYVSMDLGVNDLTVLAFFQIIHGEVRLVDYYEDKDKGVDFYAKFLLQDKRYLYNTIFIPHDGKQRYKGEPENNYEKDLKRLFAGTATKIMVLPRRDKQLSISHAKLMIDRSIFNIKRVKPFLDQLSKYRKKWHEPTGRYLEEPYHNEASNFADAWQYLAQAVQHIETVGTMSGSLQKHRQVVESRTKRII